MDPTKVDLVGEWDVSITNVHFVELTCSIAFSMQLREITGLPNAYDGEIPLEDTGIRCPNGFIYPLDRTLSNLIFQPDGKNLKVTVGTVGGTPFAVVELRSEDEMKGELDEGFSPGARFSARR